MTEDFTTPLWTGDRSSRQRIKKGAADLNNTLDQMDLTGIGWKSHPTRAEYTVLLRGHEPFSRTDRVLGHKTSLREKIEITPSNFSGHNGMKLEISHKRKTAKLTNTRKLHNTLLNSSRINGEIKGGDTKVPWDKQNMKTTYQNLLDITHKRMKRNPYLIPLTKMTSRWIKDFRIRPETRHS